MYSLEQMQEAARAKGGECLASSSAKNNEKVCWQCAKGHRWDVAPNQIIRRGTWCRRCYFDSRVKHTTDGSRRAAASRASSEWAMRNRDRVRAQHKKYRETHPDILKDRQLRNDIGVGIETYRQLFESQGGLCAVCGTNRPGGKYFSVDHNHATGKVRGLLCRKCNTGIGMLSDDHKILQCAVDYLKKHEVPHGSAA